MRLNTHSAVLALSVASACYGQSAAKGDDSSDIVAKIAKLEAQWTDAVVRGDVVTCLKIEAPDYLESDTDGTLSNRDENNAALASGAYKATSIRIDELKVRVFGDTAIVHGLETEKSMTNGKDSSGQFRFTDVFVKCDGVWMAVAEHDSKVKAK